MEPKPCVSSPKTNNKQNINIYKLNSKTSKLNTKVNRGG